MYEYSRMLKLAKQIQLEAETKLYFSCAKLHEKCFEFVIMNSQNLNSAQRQFEGNALFSTLLSFISS